MAADPTTDMASEIPVACTLSAAEMRARGEDMVAPLFTRVRDVREEPDGYRFVFPAAAESVRDLLEFVLSERDCCPFFTFELSFPSPHESVWLTLRGGEGVKEVVASGFATQDMPLVTATKAAR